MNTQPNPSQGSSVARQTGPALEAHYPFLLWLLPTLGFMGTMKGIAFALPKAKKKWRWNQSGQSRLDNLIKRQ